MANDLTTKQEAFVNAFLKTYNATAAAREAKYATPRQSGADCMSNPVIKARIQAHLDAIREEGIGNRATRLAQLADLNNNLLHIQTSRMAEAASRTEDGESLPAGADTGLLVETKKQVGKFTETVWEIDKTLVQERQKILEQAARETGDRDKRLVELTGPSGGPVQVAEAKSALLEMMSDEGDDG